MIKLEPIRVEVTRGTLVESVHNINAIAIDTEGNVFASWGDIKSNVYPRSAIKPIQALPFLESGAIEKFVVSDKEIALACASHSGETDHIRCIRRFLEKFDCDEDDLECGPHWPIDIIAKKKMMENVESPGAIHNNCSGQHCSFLATAKYMNEDTGNYLSIDHPVQGRVANVISEMCEFDVLTIGKGVDGCGIPVYALPLSAFALGLARMADPSLLPPIRKNAIKKITKSMMQFPFMVAGSERFDTLAIECFDGGLICKGGAEGVHAAIIPKLSLGIALKAEDGASRAAEVAMAAVLELIFERVNPKKIFFKKYIDASIANTRGEITGYLQVRL